MLFALRSSDRRILSLRTRLFIRLHHVALIGMLVWVSYLFFSLQFL